MGNDGRLFLFFKVLGDILFIEEGFRMGSCEAISEAKNEARIGARHVLAA